MPLCRGLIENRRSAGDDGGTWGGAVPPGAVAPMSAEVVLDMGFAYSCSVVMYCMSRSWVASSRFTSPVIRPLESV